MSDTKLSHEDLLDFLESCCCEIHTVAQWVIPLTPLHQKYNKHLNHLVLLHLVLNTRKEKKRKVVRKEYAAARAAQKKKPVTIHVSGMTVGIDAREVYTRLQAWIAEHVEQAVRKRVLVWLDDWYNESNNWKRMKNVQIPSRNRLPMHLFVWYFVDADDAGVRFDCWSCMIRKWLRSTRVVYCNIGGFDP